MSEPVKTVVTVGKYKFQIIDNMLISDEGEIYNRSFKIGGDYPDCVNVSVRYHENKPVYAYIPHAMYDPECSIETPLERGSSVIMIKTLLNHVHQQIPSIKEIAFEDKSNIECASEDEVRTKGSRFRKRGTNVIPVPLYFFSIAFNGKTWYEKYFHARQKDDDKHHAYRERIKYVFESAKFKENLSFGVFLEITEISRYRDEIKNYYHKSNTLEEFFQSMPKSDRCRLVRDWIDKFMTYHFTDFFSNSNWVISMPLSETTKEGLEAPRISSLRSPILRDNSGNEVNTSGTQSAFPKEDRSSKEGTEYHGVLRKETEKIGGGGKRKTRKYYLPNGRINYNKKSYGLGVDACDV